MQAHVVLSAAGVVQVSTLARTGLLRTSMTLAWRAASGRRLCISYMQSRGTTGIVTSFWAEWNGMCPKGRAGPLDGGREAVRVRAGARGPH